MSTTSPTARPAVEELPYDIVELKAALESMPLEVRVRIEPLVDRVIDSTRRRRKIMNLVQDALGQLRLDMKYLMFDLEATRRERDEFKKLVEGEE